MVSWRCEACPALRLRVLRPISGRSECPDLRKGAYSVFLSIIGGSAMPGSGRVLATNLCCLRLAPLVK